MTIIMSAGKCGSSLLEAYTPDTFWQLVCVDSVTMLEAHQRMAAYSDVIATDRSLSNATMIALGMSIAELPAATFIPDEEKIKREAIRLFTD